MAAAVLSALILAWSSTFPGDGPKDLFRLPFPIRSLPTSFWASHRIWHSGRPHGARIRNKIVPLPSFSEYLSFAFFVLRSRSVRSIRTAHFTTRSRRLIAALTLSAEAGGES